MSLRHAFCYTLTVFLLIASSATAEERQDKTLRGRVVNAENQPVHDALAVLRLRYGQGEDRWVVEATTDSRGNFEMSVPGNWLELGSFYQDRSVWVYAPGFAVAQASAHKQLGKEDEEPLVITLAEEEPVEFEIHQPSGEPLVGCKVKPFNWHTGHLVPEEIAERIAATTDANGTATMHGVAADSVRRVDVISDKYGTQRFPIGATTVPAVKPRLLTVVDVGTVEGRLVCDDPAVVANVRVAMETRNFGQGQAEGFGDTVTDEAGHFRMEKVAAGRYGMYIFSPDSSHLRPVLPEDVVVSGGETTNLEVDFSKTVLVRGRVVARGSDKPVFGAYVSVRHGTWRQGEDVKTDADGQFEARVLPGQISQQLIRIPSEFSDWVRVRSPNTPIEVSLEDSPYELPPLEITKSRVVEGKLVDSDGNPVPKASVSVKVAGSYLGHGRTDDQGNFQAQIPEGVEIAGWFVALETTRPLPTAIESKDPLVLRLLDPNVLAGVAETREPTPEDKLQPPATASQEENATLIVAKNILIFEGQATTWADLAEELDRRAGTKGGDLQSVRYYRTHATYDDELRTQEARNWAQMLTDTSGVDVREGGLIFNQAAERYDALQITDQWPPGAKNPVTGRVVDADGNPVADAQVVLLPPPPTTSRFGRPSIYLRDGQVRDETEMIVKRTGADGAFQFDFPTSNTNVLVASPKGFALAGATTGGEDIELTPWARVTVTLPQTKKFGVQTASLWINATPVDGGPSMGISMSQGSPDTPQQEFEFLAVPANCEVSASRTLWNEQENGGMVGRRQGEPYKFTTEPGVTHHLEFERLKQVEE